MELPWIAWYPGDYINKTRSLTMSQHGAYCLLLWEYYINGPLAKATALLNVCQSRTEADASDVALVLSQFFVEKNGFYYHERADDEISRRLSISKQRQEYGRKGGLAKASNLLEHKLKQNSTHSQSHINTNGKGGDSTISAKPRPSQNDFDERDQRLLAKAKQVVTNRVSASIGSGSFTEGEFMSAVCEECGLTPQRVKKLEGMLKWR